MWASCSNRFCRLSPLLYSFLNLLRIQEQLRLWNCAQPEPKTPIISLIILSSLHTHSNKHSTSLCTIYCLNRTFLNDSTILKTFCFLFWCPVLQLKYKILAASTQSHFCNYLVSPDCASGIILSAAGMLFFPLHLNFLVCLDKTCLVDFKNMVYKVQVTARCYWMLSGCCCVSRKAGPELILLSITNGFDSTQILKSIHWFCHKSSVQVIFISQLYFKTLSNLKCLQSHMCASITMLIYKTFFLLSRTLNFSAIMMFNDRLGKIKTSFNYLMLPACYGFFLNNWMLTAQNFIANKMGRQIRQINALLKETSFYFQVCFMQEWSIWKHNVSELTESKCLKLLK